jgi:hypothetical protein
MSIDELIQSGVDQAKRVLVGRPGASLMPAFVVQFKDRPPAMIGTPWSDDQDKDIAISAMRAMLKLYRDSVTSYLFWSEAWQAYEDKNHPIGLMPRDRMDRKEVVIINAFDKKGGKMVSLEIMRDDKGVVTDLIANDKESDLTVLSGRLHNLLKDD